MRAQKIFSESVTASSRMSHWIMTRFLPDSIVRFSWDVSGVIVIWCNYITTTIQIFNTSGRNARSALQYLDLIFDLIVLSDFILRFYRPFIDENSGQIVMDPYLIQKRYRRSFVFWVYLMTCIPIIEHPLLLSLSQYQHSAMHIYLSVVRMIRVVQLPGKFQELKKIRELKAPVNEPAFRMAVILFFIQLFTFQGGFIYSGVSTLLVSDDVCQSSQHFRNREILASVDSVITNVMDTSVCKVKTGVECDECPEKIFIIRSLYFLMQTLFTIGYGDKVAQSKSSAEMVLACFFTIFGLFAFSLIIANMTSVLANLDVVNMQFRHEMDTLSQWLKARSIPNELRQHIAIYFSYLSRSQHGMLDNVLLGELPNYLANELATLNIEMLTKVPFFKRELRSEAFLSLVATALKRRIYTPRSFICFQDEFKREMIIIKSGKAEIYVTGIPDPVGTLLPGDYIGDYQLLYATKYQVGVLAAEFTEVMVLTFEAFKEVMNHKISSHFFFSTLGFTFRNSLDEGCLKTSEAMKQRLGKISLMANSIINGKNKTKLKNMMEENTVMTNHFRVMPNSRFHVYWDLVSVVAILFYSIDSPIRIATYQRDNTLNSSFDFVFGVGYFFDVFFIVDMVLRVNVLSFEIHANGKTIIISDRTEIRRRYLSSVRSKVDLFAVVPFDFISAGIGRYHALFRLPKMIRVIQFPLTLSNLQQHFYECMDIKMNETHKSILLMVFYSTLIIVWVSSGWSTLRPNESGIIALYWAITTLSVVGYGDIVPSNFTETCYALIVAAFGAIFTATVLSNITNFFHDGEISENNTEHKVNCLKRFIDRHKISHDCAQKVADYFAYIDKELDGLDDFFLLRHSLPDTLSTNVLIHLTQPMVLKCDIFANCESCFTREVMMSMEQVFYGASYMVLTKDVPSDRMYFIKKGRVNLLEKDTLKIIRKLDSNDYFAEGCLVKKWDKNPFLAMTVTDCEIWALKRSVFRKILVDFPRSHLAFEKIALSSQEVEPLASVRSSSKTLEKVKLTKTFYLDPNSYFMQVWFCLILTVTLYSMIVLPFRVSFLENHDISKTWFVIDYFADFLFLVDMIIRGFLLAVFDENNILVVKRQDICMKYVKSTRFKYHILSALPVELAMIIAPAICPLWKLQTWSLFRLNRLLRITEMSYLIKRIESSLAKVGFKIPKNPLKVMKLLFVIFLLAHMISCVFFAIANFNQHANSGTVVNQHNWANTEGLVDASPKCPGEAVSFAVVSQQYTAALYWAFSTISTAGYGDITGDLNSSIEILYSTFVLIIGMVVLSLVISSLEDIVTQLDVTSSLYKKKTDKVNAYVQAQCLPESLKVKIASYYAQLWRSHSGVKGEKLLNFIPTYLKSDLVSDMTDPLIEKTFFIKDCAKDYVRHIANCLFLETYLPDDYLFHTDERCDTLYFLYNGRVDLMTLQDVTFKTVSHCVLAESSFFLFEPHIFSAKSSDSCEIFHLTHDAFISSLHEYQLVEFYKDFLATNHSTLLKAKATMEKTIQNLNSSKMVRFLKREDRMIKIPRGVILPESRIRVVWDFALFFGLIYQVISIPINISFPGDRISIVSFLVDHAIDFFFIVDVYCRMRKFAIVKDGITITLPKEFGKVYREKEFRLDLLSILPTSTISFMVGIRDEGYGLWRLFQLVRLVRFGKYLNVILDFINTRTQFVLATASLRVWQMLLSILVLSHWCACVFHFIGDHEDTLITWITSDQMVYDTLGRRYLRSLYWALYTMATIGYGSVPVVTIRERVFAMITMAVGAVVCGALAAVLALLVAGKDQQAGINNRRIQCCKLYMKTNNIPENLEARILEYFSYADEEMRNIDEKEVLSDLSSSLRSEILQRFCFKSLRDCAHFNAYSDGAILSVIKIMKPYLAVPGENLSEIGKEDHSLYVFRKGSLQRKDAVGMISAVVEGTIIGHLVTLATSILVGPPTHELKIELFSAALPKTDGHFYILVKDEYNQCKSSFRNSRHINEVISMKVKVENEKCKSFKTTIVVKEWHKQQNHVTIGCGEIEVSDSTLDQKATCTIFDDKGRNVGSVQIRLGLIKLIELDQQINHEMTVTALGFSHLYQLNLLDDSLLRDYFSQSKMTDISQRLPLSLRDNSDIECFNSKKSRYTESLDPDGMVTGINVDSYSEHWNDTVLLDSISIMHKAVNSDRQLSAFFHD